MCCVMASISSGCHPVVLPASTPARALAHGGNRAHRRPAGKGPCPARRVFPPSMCRENAPPEAHRVRRLPPMRQDRLDQRARGEGNSLKCPERTRPCARPFPCRGSRVERPAGRRTSRGAGPLTRPFPIERPEVRGSPSTSSRPDCAALNGRGVGTNRSSTSDRHAPVERLAGQRRRTRRRGAARNGDQRLPRARPRARPAPPCRQRLGQRPREWNSASPDR